MANSDRSVKQKERRLSTRGRITKSLHVKVTVRPLQGAERSWKEASEDCWQGRLRNICECGAQILMEAACAEQLHTNQSVKLQIDASSSGTEIKTEVIGQIRYILPDGQDNTITLGIEFSESELPADIKGVINRIF